MPISVNAANITNIILGIILILSSLGVVVAKKPVYSALSFLLTLVTLATFYLMLSAQFIAVMQVLVYAGAILVLFMFVMVLFQDAHDEIVKFKPKSMPLLIGLALFLFLVALLYLGLQMTGLLATPNTLPNGYGTVQSLGKVLYIDFFFPFEVVVLLFLVALVGALYIARKVA
jgi:NADH-quinone oxidoreductase subunit J